MVEIGIVEIIGLGAPLGIIGTMLIVLYFSRKQAQGFNATYILFISSHAYAMRQRNVLKDDEWTGWLQWMRNCFKYGTIGEHWKQIQSENWFDPSFQVFVNKELIPGT